GLVNLDFADIRAVMSDGGVAMIGVGESDSQNRAIEAVEKAIENPLLDVDISGASGALVNIIGGLDLSLDEARKVIETVGNKISKNSKMIWGAQLSEDMDRTLRVLLIITGVKSSQILGPGEGRFDKEKREIEEELGIEFVEEK
ncbi:MAG: cell division protein FtsZ, partial [Candidatus Pacearchaeota archaeon]|nr:cell division protein FtsZ [Candidatus Pacearchaeota archaeon]